MMIMNTQGEEAGLEDERQAALDDVGYKYNADLYIVYF